MQRLPTPVPEHFLSHSALSSYGLLEPLTLWRLSVSVRPLYQALGNCPTSGASWSSAMPPSLGRGRVTTTTDSGLYRDSCLPNSDSSTQRFFNVPDCHITALQRQVHVAEVVKYIGQVRKHHNKLFIVKLDTEVVFVFSKKDLTSFNLIFKFIQPKEAFVSPQPTDFDIKQKSHMLRSHFFGQKLKEPVNFSSCTNEVDHFHRNIHNFHQM